MAEAETIIAANELRKARAALLSLVAAFFLAALKLVIGIATSSLAILSEALHSALDLVAALMTWQAVRVSSQPPDQQHTYGHGRVENLSALAETLLLFGVCAYVGFEGAHRLMDQESPVLPSLWAIGCMVVSIVVDITRSRALRKVARETKSQALEADAAHFSTDMISSAAVLCGVAIVWAGDFFALPEPWGSWLRQADTVAALIAAVIIFRISLTLCREAVNCLMDAAPEGASDKLEKAVLSVPGVISLDRLRLRSAGPSTFADLNIGVDPALSVAQGHRIAAHARAAVRKVLPGADVVVHVDPRKVPAEPRTRLSILGSEALRAGLDVHAIRRVDGTGGEDAEKIGAREPLLAEVHVEFNGSASFTEAFAQCRAFETACKAKDPSLTALSRIVPRETVARTRPLGKDQAELRACVERVVSEQAGREPLLSRPHDLDARVDDDGALHLSFHCVVGADITVSQAHELSTRLERRVRAGLPQAGEIFIHLQPASAGMKPDEADLGAGIGQ